MEEWDQWPYWLCSALIVLIVFCAGFAATYLLTIRSPDDPTVVVEEVSFKLRLDATDKVVNAPFFALVSFLAFKGSWDLRADAQTRWHGSSPTAVFCVTLYTSRMIFDTICQQYSLSDDSKKRLQMTAHHVLSGIAVSSSMWCECAYFFACFDICCEITTVFLTAIFAVKMFLAPGGTADTIRAVCGLFLWLGFLAFRLLLFPMWLYIFISDSLANPDTTWSTIPVIFRYFWPGVTAFLLVLSTIWFIPITKGLVKALTGGKRAKKKSS